MGKAHWFLRPARLPIPPSGRESLGVGVGVGVGVMVWMGVSESKRVCVAIVGCEDNRFGSVVQIIYKLGTAF